MPPVTDPALLQHLNTQVGVPPPRSRPPMLGQAGPQPWISAPRQAPLHTQMTPDEETRARNEAAASSTAPALAAAQTAAAQATAAAAQRQAARGDLTADQMASLRSQFDSLSLLDSGIREVENLYTRDFRGRSSRAFGYLPDAMSPTNQAFNNASNRLMSAIASAQGLTAQQQNTPTELRIRFGPMLPTSTDTDETIEQKLGALRSILNQQRATLSHQLGIQSPDSGPSSAAANGTPPPNAPSSGSPGPPTGPQAAEGEPSGLVVDVWPGGPPPRDRSQANAAWQNAFQRASMREPGLTWDAFIARNLAPVGQNAAPAPDISGARGGSPEAMNRAIGENTISSGVPLLGPLVQADQALRGPEAGNAMLHGGQDWAMFGGRDEMSAGLDTMLGNGTYDQNIARHRGTDQYDSQNNFYDRLGGQLATGAPEALLPGGLPAQAMRGGAQGTAYGFGSGEGGFAQRAPNALLGGAIGAAAPPLLAAGGAAARTVAPRIGQAARWAAGRARPNVTAEGQSVAQAGAAENVPVSGPMLDPATRARMAYLESSMGSGGPVRSSLDATQAGIQRRMGEIAGPGAANEQGAMGARVQAGLRDSVSARGRSLRADYQRASGMAADIPVLGGNALQRLDGHIAQLEQNAGQNAPLLNYLRTVRGDLVNEHGFLVPKTVQAFRDMRTNLRGNISNANLTHTNAERIMSDVLDGARDDINYFVGARNPAAARLYQQTDQQYAAHQTEIRQVVDRLVGRADNPLGGGAVMSRVTGLAAGDVPRLQRVWAMLPAQERADLAATIASRAGYKSPDEPFSVQQFVAWQRTIPDSARQVIFGADGARSIQNLTILAKSLQATRAELNNSRSGVVQNWRDTIRSFLGGNWLPLAAGGAGGYGTSSAIGGAVTSAALAGTGMAARRLSAKALMNPELSAWLPIAARTATPTAMRTQLGRLARIAARNPAIAQEVNGLRQTLSSAANDNSLMTGSLAASPNQRPDQPYQ